MAPRNIHHYFTRSRKRPRTHPQNTMTDMATGPDVANIGTQAGPGTIWDAATRRKYYANRKRRRTYYNKKQRGAYYRGRRYGSGRSSTFTSDGKLTQVVGRGGYWSDAFRKMGGVARSLVPEGAFSKIGAAGGGALGSYFGRPDIGQYIGNLAGQGVAKIAGFGAYHVKANSILAQLDEGVQIPQFGDAAHATVVRHREFIQDIPATGGAVFTNYPFIVNPGVITTFPWLAVIARQYEQYQILGMIFEYKTTFSDITTGGPMGSVIMASDYDVLDTAFATKVEMENSQYAVSEKPSISFLHAIECDPSATFSPMKFIRHNDAVETLAEARLHDHCEFQLATVGLPTSTGNIGELWVSYEIALYKPQIANIAAFGLTDHFTLPTTVAATHYLGPDTTTTLSPNGGSTLLGTCQNSTYTFPPGITGKFTFLYVVRGASTALTNAIAVTLTNATSELIFYNDTSSNVQLGAGITSIDQIFHSTLDIATGGCTVRVSAGTLPGTITSADLFITNYAGTVTT